MGVVVHGQKPIEATIWGLLSLDLWELSDEELADLWEACEAVQLYVENEWARRDDGSTSPTGSDEIPPA